MPRSITLSTGSRNGKFSQPSRCGLKRAATPTASYWPSTRPVTERPLHWCPNRSNSKLSRTRRWRTFLTVLLGRQEATSTWQVVRLLDFDSEPDAGSVRLLAAPLQPVRCCLADLPSLDSEPGAVLLPASPQHGITHVSSNMVDRKCKDQDQIDRRLHRLVRLPFPVRLRLLHQRGSLSISLRRPSPASRPERDDCKRLSGDRPRWRADDIPAPPRLAGRQRSSHPSRHAALDMPGE